MHSTYSLSEKTFFYFASFLINETHQDINSLPFGTTIYTILF